MTVEVVYFAVLREQSGMDRETVETSASTYGELYEELSARHGFTLPGSRVRVAIDNAFTDSDSTVRDGVEVVFIPPVAGG